MTTPFTDVMYFGIKDGRVLACGWQQMGSRGRANNAKMMAEWARDGLTIESAIEGSARFDELHNGMANRTSVRPQGDRT